MTLNESIPVRREPVAGDSVAGGELAWMGGLVILVLFVFAVWGKLRKTGAGKKDIGRAEPVTSWLTRLQGKAAHAPAVLGSTRLTPTHSLHDVQWQGRRLLVGCSSQSIQVLSEMPESGQPSEDILNSDASGNKNHEVA